VKNRAERERCYIFTLGQQERGQSANPPTFTPSKIPGCIQGEEEEAN